MNVQGGKTALHWAAEGGHVSMAEYLVGHGADIEANTRVSRVGKVFVCLCMLYRLGKLLACLHVRCVCMMPLVCRIWCDMDVNRERVCV